MRRVILLIAFAASVSVSNAQSSVRDLEKYLTDIKTNPYLSLPKTLLEDSKNEDKLVKVLQGYTSDSIVVVKSRAYYIIKVIGKRSKDAKVRQAAVTSLIKGIKDVNTGVSGTASEALSGFAQDNFTQEAKEALKQSLDPRTSHLHQVIKLVGYLEMKDQQPKLTNILASNAKATDKWACQLALARMGDATAINFILEKVKSAKLNDDLVYTIVPDLVYTKQKLIFDYLIEIINNDTPSCQSPNPDSNVKILCGYRVMESIAPAIEKYPLLVNDFGELNVTDYKEALTKVRTWFSENPDYKIRSDGY